MFNQHRDGSLDIDYDERFKGRSGWGKRKVDDAHPHLTAEGDEYRLELVDERRQLLSHVTRKVSFKYPTDAEPSFEMSSLALDERLPIPESMISAPRLKVRGLRNGFLMSETTLGGAPPVANAGPDLLLECQGGGVANGMLDGRGSSDPDGDMISSYAWSLSGAVLSDATSATASGNFPLGTTVAALLVRDGRYESPLDTVNIAVRDSVPPQVSCFGGFAECTGSSTPVMTACAAIDVCEGVLATTSTALGSYPLGTHSFSCAAGDVSGNRGEATCNVAVIDTAPPIITLSPGSAIAACSTDSGTVQLALPAISDSCGQGVPTLSGKVTAIKGKTLASPIAIPADGKLILPNGTVDVVWDAADASGNRTSLAQSFVVALSETEACCTPGQTVVRGTTSADTILRASGAHCVLGLAGGDVVQTSTASDSLFGGPDADVLNAGGGQDMLSGGSGADVMNCGAGGNCEVHGGDGNDTIQAASAASAKVWGGAGADVITGSAGSDVIVPGEGADVVSAGSGADTIVLYDVCEATSGKILDGGSGSDVLITPVPVSELMTRGVLVSGFETITVDTSKRHLSPCF